MVFLESPLDADCHGFQGSERRVDAVAELNHAGLDKLGVSLLGVVGKHVSHGLSEGLDELGVGLAVHCSVHSLGHHVAINHSELSLKRINKWGDLFVQMSGHSCVFASDLKGKRRLTS